MKSSMSNERRSRGNDCHQRERHFTGRVAPMRLERIQSSRMARTGQSMRSEALKGSSGFTPGCKATPQSRRAEGAVYGNEMSASIDGQQSFR